MLFDAAYNFLDWLVDTPFDLPDSLVKSYTNAHIAFRSAVGAYDSAYAEDCLMDLVAATKYILYWYSDEMPSIHPKSFALEYKTDYLALRDAYNNTVVGV